MPIALAVLIAVVCSAQKKEWKDRAGGRGKKTPVLSFCFATGFGVTKSLSGAVKCGLFAACLCQLLPW